MTSDTNTRNIGIAGGVLLAIGVFMPAIGIPFLGDITFMQNARGSGVLVLLAGVAGAILAHRGSRSGMLAAGIVGGGLVAVSFIGLQMRIQQVKTEIVGTGGGFLSGLGDMLARSVRMEWGWAVLILGAGLLLYGAAGGRGRN